MPTCSTRQLHAFVPPGASDFLGRASSAQTNVAGEIQLSYRAEMAAIFMDLAIDLGIRHSAASAGADLV
jgi:hypothetical protein